MPADLGYTLRAMSRELADRLGPIEVFDCDGARVSLGSLWADRACVLVFVRHFG